MAEQKIFAGPRIRRIRNAKGLTQTAMADGLGISPSYLNLIERNQRPLTVQLILKLVSIYKVDAEELQGEARGSVAALREVFADPLLAGELPGDQELIEIGRSRAQHGSGRHQALSRLSRAGGRGSPISPKCWRAMARSRRCPARGCRSTKCATCSSAAPATLPVIEGEAEAFASLLDPGDDLLGALKAWLKREHGIVVRVLPVGDDAELATPLRPAFAAAFHLGAAVAARPAARDRHGSLPVAHVRRDRGGTRRR